MKKIKVTEQTYYRDYKPEIIESIDHAFDLVDKGSKKAEKIIQKLIKKYPFVPELQQELASFYFLEGNDSKLIPVLNRTIELFPDFLFARIALSGFFIMKLKLNQAYEVLGAGKSLDELIPSRNSFSTEEIFQFYRLVIKYHLTIDDLKKADELLDEALEILNEGSSESDQLVDLVFEYERNNVLKALSRNASFDVHDANVSPLTTDLSKIEYSEDWQNPEIEELYVSDTELPKQLIEKILQLDRDSLIADLEQILRNSFVTYPSIQLEENFKADRTEVIHAVSFLAHLESARHLPLFLDILRMPAEYLSYYFGDYLFDFFWMDILRVGKNQLDVLEQFLLEPNYEYLSHTVVADAFVQLALNHPEQKSQVIGILNNVLSADLKMGKAGTPRNSEEVAFTIFAVIDLGAVELLDTIKLLFDHDLVSVDVLGEYKYIHQAISSSLLNYPRVYHMPIWKKYEVVNAFYSSYFTTPSLTTSPTSTPFATSRKIGRNDPCPCGSGKKYKKCCL